MNRIVKVGDIILSRVFLGHFCKVINVRKPLFKKPNFYNCKYKVQDIFHSNKTAWCDYKKIIRLDADLSDYDRNACWDSAGDFADRMLGDYEVVSPISDNDEIYIILCDPVMDLPEKAVGYFRHRNDACNWVNGVLISLESNHYLQYDILNGTIQTQNEFDHVIELLSSKWDYFQECSELSQLSLPSNLPEYDFNTITMLGGIK